jgi:hypothetical protein
MVLIGCSGVYLARSILGAELLVRRFFGHGRRPWPLLRGCVDARRIHIQSSQRCCPVGCTAVLAPLRRTPAHSCEHPWLPLLLWCTQFFNDSLLVRFTYYRGNGDRALDAMELRSTNNADRRDHRCRLIWVGTPCGNFKLTHYPKSRKLDKQCLVGIRHCYIEPPPAASAAWGAKMRFQFTIRDLLLIIVIAGLAAGWWIDHQRINRLTIQQWEYAEVSTSTGQGIQEATFARLGSEGWEIVAVERTGSVETFWVKRPKR